MKIYLFKLNRTKSNISSLSSKQVLLYSSISPVHEEMSLSGYRDTSEFSFPRRAVGALFDKAGSCKSTRNVKYKTCTSQL